METTTTIITRMTGEFARNREPPFPNEVLGIPMFFLWNLLFVLILALIFYWLLRSSRRPHESALDVLKKRYASGELKKEEYEEMRKTIE